ncbi:hypothetical protein C0J52_04144 [Blattella germanica]|nr:hypothetical protein C0J52_04144 [Blattella germanica]
MESGHAYSKLRKENDLEHNENISMPTGEVETSYINCVGPSQEKPSSNSEPNVLIDNPRTNKQNHAVGSSESPKKDFVKMSKRIPYWLWYLIAKALGLKLKPNDKPICAIFLYLLTVLSALGYVIASIWYYVFDVIANHKGRSAQLEGTVTILMTTLWCALGVYANKLAYRLFGNIKFLDMLRLHSKTVFKLNAAFVVFFLWTAFIVLLNLGTLKFWHGEPCDKGIRRFIGELEQDAIAVDTRDDTARELAKEYALVEDEDDLTEDSDAEMRTTRGRNRVGDSNHTLSTVIADSMGVSVPSRSESSNPVAGMNTPIILSNADILHQYWNLMVKLRISSLALQRWMVSVMAMIIVWAAMNLVHWLSHDPKLYDVLNFLIPLMLLPLLCSAYSEVNNEGLRVAKASIFSLLKNINCKFLAMI